MIWGITYKRDGVTYRKSFPSWMEMMAWCDKARGIADLKFL
jgi:hypothetical protein